MNSDHVFIGHFTNMFGTLKEMESLFQNTCSYMVMCLMIYPKLLLNRHEYDYDATSWIIATDIRTPWMKLEISSSSYRQLYAIQYYH